MRSAENPARFPSHVQTSGVRFAVFVEIPSRLWILEIIAAGVAIIVLTRVHAGLTCATTAIAHATCVRAANRADRGANRRAGLCIAVADVIADHGAGDAAKHRASGGPAFNVACLRTRGGHQRGGGHRTHTRYAHETYSWYPRASKRSACLAVPPQRLNGAQVAQVRKFRLARAEKFPQYLMRIVAEDGRRYANGWRRSAHAYRICGQLRGHAIRTRRRCHRAARDDLRIGVNLVERVDWSAGHVGRFERRHPFARRPCAHDGCQRLSQCLAMGDARFIRGEAWVVAKRNAGALAEISKLPVITDRENDVAVGGG